MGTVVVHGEAAAKVEIAHGRAFLRQARVNAGGLHDGRANVTNVRHLGAEVVVHELEAVEHVVLLQGINHVHNLGGRQAEGGTLAA